MNWLRNHPILGVVFSATLFLLAAKLIVTPTMPLWVVFIPVFVLILAIPTAIFLALCYGLLNFYRKLLWDRLTIVFLVLKRPKTYPNEFQSTAEDFRTYATDDFS